MTPNYLRSPKISVSPYCDCNNSGNNKDECDKFTEIFTENACLRELSILLLQQSVLFSGCICLSLSLCCFVFFKYIQLCSAGCSLLYCSCYTELPSQQIYPIAMLALLSLFIIKQTVTVHCSLWEIVPTGRSRTPAPDLWQDATFLSNLV